MLFRSDQIVCENNAAVDLSGSISGQTTTGYWFSNGTGTFDKDSSNLILTYTPSQEDIDAGFTFVALESTENGDCYIETDFVKITFSAAPEVSAGNDIIACNDEIVNLSGDVVNFSNSGFWYTLGSGNFTPTASA